MRDAHIGINATKYEPIDCKTIELISIVISDTINGEFYYANENKRLQVEVARSRIVSKNTYRLDSADAASSCVRFNTVTSS